AAERLLNRLDKVHRLLADPDRSSVRIALALEKLSIVEAQRSFTYFHLFGYPADLVVCNRVLPSGKDSDGSFAGLRATQQAYLPEVMAQYAPVPVRVVPQFDREMIGLERLAEIAHALFGEDDPTAFFYRGRPYQVRAEDGGHVLEVALPFTSREGVQLSRALVDAPTTGAKMDDGILRIKFGTRADVAPEKAAKRVKVVAGGTRR